MDEGDGGCGHVPGPAQGQLQQDSPLPLLMSSIVARSHHRPQTIPGCTPEKEEPKKPFAAFRGIHLGMPRAQSRPVLAPCPQNVHSSFLFVLSFCNEKVRNARLSRMDPWGMRTDAKPRL